MRPQLYASPISLPEARSGRFAIRYHSFKPGEIAIVSMREAILTGRRPVSVRMEKPLRVHQLVETRVEGVDVNEQGNPVITGTEGVWMSDEPLELRQAAEWILTARPRGRVLVGGLGLGIVATWLAQRKDVDHVEVVEREQDVIDLVATRQSGYTVRKDDIFNFLRTVKVWVWDYAFLDTWQGTNEATWWDTVMPLRRIIGNRFPHMIEGVGMARVHCWAEDQMLGQVTRAFLTGNRSIMSLLLKRTGEKVPDGPLRHWYYDGFPEEMTEADVKHFTSRVGLPDWEERWSACLREPK